MLEVVEKLSLHEQFRLIEIAHETSDSAIRKYALGILEGYLAPRQFTVKGLVADHNSASGFRTA